MPAIGASLASAGHRAATVLGGRSFSSVSATLAFGVVLNAAVQGNPLAESARACHISSGILTHIAVLEFAKSVLVATATSL
jgi:hypothetical protein